MCFYYSITHKVKDALADLKSSDSEIATNEDTEPLYYINGFTFPVLPAFVSIDGIIKLEHLQWGLIPHWAKDTETADKLRGMTLNARSETVFDKPAFKSAINKSRCLIPSTGFFEWTEHNKKKYPFYIYPKESNFFYFAGIKSEWLDKTTGEVLSTFSILTISANKLMEKIHNTKKRMPLILDDDSRLKWIDNNLNKDEIKPFFQQFPDSKMDFHPISKLITDRFNDKNVPDLIKEFSYPELEGEF